MFTDANSIVINEINMGQYLVSAKFGYHKLWGKDFGRNLIGSNSGSLVGIFPKLTLQFRKLTREEVEYLAPTLDSAFQLTTYYDPELKRMNTISTYSSDWVLENKNIINENHKNEGFEWSVVSNNRR